MKLDWTINLPTLLAIAGLIWGAARLSMKIEYAEAKAVEVSKRLDTFAAANDFDHREIMRKITHLP